MLLRYVQTVVLCSGLIASTQVVAQQAETAQSARGQESATPPSLIKIAGVMKDEIGRPLTGAMSVTFSLYKDEQSSAPLWVETQNLTVGSDGHYNAFLGVNSKEGAPVNLFASGDLRWLGVKVDNLVEQPRILFGVPFTLKSEDVKRMGSPASVNAPATTGPGEVQESNSSLYQFDTVLPLTQVIKDVIGPGCSGNTCTSTATWPGGGFADTNYTVACSPDRGTTQPQTGELITLTKTATTIRVQLLGVCAEGCDSPSMTAFECIGVHD
ncbi:MAG TPA: hypothetical protein VJQ59_08510 [Candidatus Sulfotelmatobacter sp.]|nr:hypothetical protein [Candidatus Sulfotelmatobacter sp.]